MMPCKIISLAQQKGGVGKTTTVINLGSALAQRGKKILLVDLDPQGALSAGLGLNPLSLEKTIYNVLRSSSVSLAEIITQSKTGCDLVPANIDLAAAEVELVSEPGREHFLREALSPVIDRYDYVLIDCQPSLGLLTLNALSASSGVIIPVQTQYFALRGMDLLFQTIEKVQARLNPKLKIVGILPTMYDARTIHAREVLEELKRAYPELILSAVVPHTIKFADSSMAGDSVLSLNPDSQAAEAYRELATEVEKRV
jgi:chromosome partitioning protein